MKLENFKPFIGQNCETTTAGNLLKQLGIELSESLLFGIGEGLAYIIWNMKTMDFPFIGGRVKPDLLTENICRNLNLNLAVKETSSLKKAWSNIQTPLSNGKAVGLKLDSYHLDYFTNKIHFAGHYVTIYGYDDKFAYLIDTQQQGGKVKTTLENLQLARNEKGPMSSRNKSYTIDQIQPLPEMDQTIKMAIYNNAVAYLNPPIRNLGYKGIQKTAKVILEWFKRSKSIKSEFHTSAMLMERAGTGGALFRNLYSDFLKESADILGLKELKEGYESFKEHAILWTEISNLFLKIGDTEDEKYLIRASELFLELAETEKQTMEKLKKACA